MQEREEKLIREKIVQEAKSWLRTPYHHQGDLKGIGVDCAQFLIKVYSELKLAPDLDIKDYSMQWHLHRGEEKYLDWILKYARPISVENVKPGDIAMFRFGRVASHAAIVIAWPNVIHSYNGIGVTIDDATKSPLNDRSKNRFVGAFTLCQFSTPALP